MARITTLKEQLAAPIEDGRPEKQQDLDTKHAELLESNKVVNKARFSVDQLTSQHAEAVQAGHEAIAAEDKHDQAVKRLDTAQTRHDAITVPAEVDTSALVALQKDLKAEQDRKLIQGHWDALNKLKASDEWDEGAEALAKAVADLGVKITERGAARVLTAGFISNVESQINTHKLNLTALEAKVIKETHCAFCDKDLTDVPEVANYNGALAPQIAQVKANIAALQETLTTHSTTLGEIDSAVFSLTEERDELQAVQQAGAARASVYQAAAEYIKLDEKYVPARWTWTGPDMSKPAAAVAAAKIKAINDAVTARSQAQGRLQEAATALQTAKAEATAAAEAFKAAQSRSESFVTVREGYAELVEAFNEALQADEAAKSAVNEAQRALTHAGDLYNERLKARSGLQKQLETAEQELVVANFANAMLKKLKGARPVVANKLWGLVLGAVSKYFSQIRGKQSVVTRSDKGFLVDGQKVGPGSLSGSALDALGLAIRIALTKTFLPNTRFMVLDEPAAAADADRETNMIGLIAGADFDQILLVTHSDLADSFAAQVIQL